MVARAPDPRPELLAHDCATCALSVIHEDSRADLLVCTHPLILTPRSPVELWRVAADLDALGWPEMTAEHAPCPGWIPGWGEDDDTDINHEEP